MIAKIKLFALFASIAGSIFILAIVQILIFVIGDIMSGALRGVPETGWGFMIVILFLCPVAVMALAVFFILGKKFTSATRKSVWLLWAISAVFALLILAGYMGYNRLTRPPENPRDAKKANDLREINTKIDHLYYKNNNSLPSESELAQSLVQGTTYKIINDTTYVLCGNFEKDTTPDYSGEKETSSSGSEIVKKVIDGETLESREAMGTFKVHKAGTQCYTIALSKPGTR